MALHKRDEGSLIARSQALDQVRLVRSSASGRRCGDVITIEVLMVIDVPCVSGFVVRVEDEARGRPDPHAGYTRGHPNREPGRSCSTPSTMMSTCSLKKLTNPAIFWLSGSGVR